MSLQFGDFVKINRTLSGLLREIDTDSSSYEDTVTGIVILNDSPKLTMNIILAVPKTIMTRWSGRSIRDLYTFIPGFIFQQYNFWWCSDKILTITEKEYEI